MRDLELGDIVPLHVADFVHQASAGSLAGSAGVVLAFAVAHPAGLILFETGFGRAELAGVESTYGARALAHYEVVEHPLEGELARHGFGVGDVRAIVNSHLHLDHCGSNRLFPGVPIYAQASEYEAARAGGRTYTVPEWVDFPGAEYVFLDGSRAIDRGLRVVPTPGHTVGHQSLVVETCGGRVVLAGQAVYSRADFEAGLEGSRQLLDLVPRRVHFSHDHAVWNADPP